MTADLPPSRPLLPLAAVVGWLCAAVALWQPALWWVAAVWLAVLLGLISWGVVDIGSGIFLTGVCRGPAERPKVALTFDDGPDPRWTPEVLRALAASGQRATFFLIGERVEAHPELVVAIREAGHEIGCHSFDHGIDYAFRSRGGLERDLERARSVLRQAGAGPLRWYRPPVGLLNPRIAATVHRSGLELAGWSVRPRDGVATADAPIRARVAAGLAPGAVVLLHDGPSPHASDSGTRPAGVAALPGVLDDLKERGLVSVTLSELVEAS